MIRTQEETLKLTIDSMHEGLQVIDRKWRYVYLNRVAAQHGRSTPDHLIGRSMIESYPGIEQTEAFRDFRAVMDSRLPRRRENHFRYSDGQKVWFELFIEPHPEGILIRSMDITQRKQIEEQLLHAQRLEALGQMAGGVAHEFNNKLATMLAYTELALRETDSRSQIGEYLTAILKAVQQSSAVTKKILAFSRKQLLSPDITDLNALLVSMRPTLLQVTGSTTGLEYALAPNLHPVFVDGQQMEQAILNLCLNARDALLTGGTITLETANLDLLQNSETKRPGIAPGRYVELTVSDNGPGMDRATLERVFEPFFTTKDKGTGLGLAMVHGMVTQSNGQISVESEVGMGSIFRIVLPAVAELPIFKMPHNEGVTSTIGGSECILLVEDDEMLRPAYQSALSRAGYHVLSSKDAHGAIRIFNDERDRIQLLVTDIELPKMSGTQLADSLLQREARLQVVYLSGRPETQVLDGRSSLLNKPISLRDLLKTVRETLDRAISAPPGAENNRSNDH